MSMSLTTPCVITNVTGFDGFGQATLGASTTEKCGIVRLRAQIQHTTVRADSSGTRGFADENATDNVLLLSPVTVARNGDKLVVDGVSIRINSVFLRRDVDGRADHYEVRGELWDS